MNSAADKNGTPAAGQIDLILSFALCASNSGLVNRVIFVTTRNECFNLKSVHPESNRKLQFRVAFKYCG